MMRKSRITHNPMHSHCKKLFITRDLIHEKGAFITIGANKIIEIFNILGLTKKKNKLMLFKVSRR